MLFDTSIIKKVDFFMGSSPHLLMATTNSLVLGPSQNQSPKSTMRASVAVVALVMVVALLLAVNLDGLVVGLGAKHDAPIGAERGALGAMVSVASLLLGVGLLTAASNLTMGEGGGGATTSILLVSDEATIDDGSGGVRRGSLEVKGHLTNPLAGKG